MKAGPLAGGRISSGHGAGAARLHAEPVVSNNGVHDSAGGVASAGLQVSFTEIGKACGYTNAWRVDHSADVAEKVAQLRAATGPAMLEILVQKGARPDLGRPKTTLTENKTAYQGFLSR
jgi:phosphonopyruvate decarboxylase